ncbi:hypothetical protein A0128_20030 [Leptospira tipperaryensis]|uniref:Uncharacterized protein n=1 Tax=Leptospira tipperaryensis TaxID=2564040 RepID=A0A1D7V3C2_9LEPT|nr:hypothetical protein A0128_20030 [Leptospira tipperaryensis]
MREGSTKAIKGFLSASVDNRSASLQETAQKRMIEKSPGNLINSLFIIFPFDQEGIAFIYQNKFTNDNYTRKREKRI